MQKNPVIISGGGVVQSDGGVDAVRKLAEQTGCYVVSTYSHNDSFPSDHWLWLGPLGHCGSKVAMSVVSEADCLICLGTRLGPSTTQAQYGNEFWPELATVVQVDIDPKILGRRKPFKAGDVGICGDVTLATLSITSRLRSGDQPSFVAGARARSRHVKANLRPKWEKDLANPIFGDSMEGAISPNDQFSGLGRMAPREVLRELEQAMPENAMVATDVGYTCSMANSFLRFKEPRTFFASMGFGSCGYAFPAVLGAKVARPDRPAIAYVGENAWGMCLTETLTAIREEIPATVVVFNNRQWDANNPHFTGFTGIARSMGAEGVQISRLEDVGPALQAAVEAQGKGKTTVVEVMTSREPDHLFPRHSPPLSKRLLAKNRSLHPR